MRKIARLTVLFTITFALLFAGSILFQLLALWNGTARAVVPRENAPGLFTLGTRAIPWSLYLSVLFTLSYTVRKGLSAPASMICVFSLALAATLGASIGMRRLKAFPQGPLPAARVEAPQGLLLSDPSLQVILLAPSQGRGRGGAGAGGARGAGGGPRALSMPGKPLVYQETPVGPRNRLLPAPDIPFRSGADRAFRSVLLDLNLSASALAGRLEGAGGAGAIGRAGGAGGAGGAGAIGAVNGAFPGGLFPFCLYAGALILLLVSLRFIFTLGEWPLAGLFIGAVIFRGVLALEAFLNAEDARDFLALFFGSLLPPLYLTPAVFTALAVLILFFSFLVYLGWHRRGGGAGAAPEEASTFVPAPPLQEAP